MKYFLLQVCEFGSLQSLNSDLDFYSNNEDWGYIEQLIIYKNKNLKSMKICKSIHNFAVAIIKTFRILDKAVQWEKPIPSDYSTSTDQEELAYGTKL